MRNRERGESATGVSTNNYSKTSVLDVRNNGCTESTAPLTLPAEGLSLRQDLLLSSQHSVVLQDLT